MNTETLKPPHIPVLLNETLACLDIQPDDIVMDGTIGFGGHSAEILTKLGPNGRLIGVDQDPSAIEYCQNRFSSNPQVVLEYQRFDQLDQIMDKYQISAFNKVLLDIGMSSYQLDLAHRGFSFQKLEDLLDMRMNSQNPLTAAEILNTYSGEELFQIFRDYGELYHPEKLVEYIMTTRNQKPLATVSDLMTCVKKGFFFRNNRNLYMKISAQVFQSLRIAVNSELDVLHSFLEKIVAKLAPNGRLVIISFHSLEDRMIKEFGKKNDTTLQNLTPKVIQAPQSEIKKNIRAKPAKLRAYLKRT